MQQAVRETLGKAVYATWQSGHPEGATLPWEELDEDWQELECKRAEVAVNTLFEMLIPVFTNALFTPDEVKAFLQNIVVE